MASKRRPPVGQTPEEQRTAWLAQARAMLGGGTMWNAATDDAVIATARVLGWQVPRFDAKPRWQWVEHSFGNRDHVAEREGVHLVVEKRGRWEGGQYLTTFAPSVYINGMGCSGRGTRWHGSEVGSLDAAKREAEGRADAAAEAEVARLQKVLW